jgi:hypothetical protein
MARKLVIAGILLALVLAAACGGDRRTFADEDEFVAAEKQDGWVVVGRFGEAWPARITDTATDYGRIEFIGLGGTPHAYSGSDGYDMQVVRLRGAEGQEFIRVLRSAEMTGIVGDNLRR